MVNLTEGLIGKKIKVLCKDGRILEGKCVSYIPAKDNEPAMDSIWIEKTVNAADEIYENEIKSLEFLDMKINEIIQVKYIGKDDSLVLRNGKIYNARVLKKGWYGIIDETNEEYAFPPEIFERII